MGWDFTSYCSREPDVYAANAIPMFMRDYDEAKRKDTNSSQTPSAANHFVQEHLAFSCSAGTGGQTIQLRALEFRVWVRCRLNGFSFWIQVRTYLNP